MLGRIVIIAALVAPLAFSGNAPVQVRFDQLASHPKRYNGKLVSVDAYYNIDLAEHSSSLASVPKAESKGLPQIFVDLPRSVSDAQARQTKNKRVRIVGRFEYRELKTRSISSAIEEHTLGFGWGGIYDMQLTKISEFKILR